MTTRRNWLPLTDQAALVGAAETLPVMAATPMAETPPFSPPLTQSRPRSTSALALLVLAAATLLLSLVVVKDEVRMFRPSWLLHPDETGMLFIAEHLAETGSVVVEDDWFQQSPGHVPEGVSTGDGRLAPQKAPLGYVAYAAAFLVSDDGWRYVAPFFGLAAACCVGWLAFQRTSSRPAAVAAAVAFLLSSPVIIYASGLAFVDIIATAFFLCGVASFDSYMNGGSRWMAVATGAALGAAMLTRLDFFVAAPIALGTLFWCKRHAPWRATLRSAVPGILPFAGAMALIALANWRLYGSPLTTGYPAGSWQSSPDSVGLSIIDFSPLDFAGLSRSYLLQIGLSCSLLFALGLFVKARLHQWTAGDGLLIGFAAFALFYFLGKEGAYGSDGAWLVSSYPRYLLPVYAAGAVAGIEGLYLAMRNWRWSVIETSAAFAAAALLAAAIGFHEAFTNERGAPYAERVTRTHNAIREVAGRTPNPVVVSDVNSKAIVGDYTITPRLLDDPSYIVRYVQRELQARRHVLLVPERGHRLYSGYMEYLEAAGYTFVLRRSNPLVYEVYNPALAEGPAPGEGEVE